MNADMKPLYMQYKYIFHVSSVHRNRHDSYKIVPSSSMHYSVQCRSVAYIKVSRISSVKRKSQLLHCASVWWHVGLSASYAQQGAVLSDTLHQAARLALISQCLWWFLNIALQSQRVFGKEEVESRLICDHLGVSHYRLQILFFFNVEDLVCRAGNLKEKTGRQRLKRCLHRN